MISMGILIQLGKSTKTLPRDKGLLVQAEANEKLGMLPSAGHLANAESPQPQGCVDRLLLSILASILAVLLMVVVVVRMVVGVVHVLGAGAAPS